MNPLTSKAIRIVIVAGIALLMFAKFLTPWLIEQAYYGKSFEVVNALIRGQASHPVSFYQSEWDTLATPFLWAYAIWGLLAVVLFDVMIRPTFFNKFVGKATPGALGAIRILVCGILFLNLWWEDLPSSTLVPPDLRVTSGALQLFYVLPFFREFVESQLALGIAQWLTLGLLLCGAAGWKTRYVLPLAAIGWFVLGGIIRQSLWFFHQGITPWYVLVALAFLPCGNGLSVDRLLKVARGQAPESQGPTPTYGFARYVCWVIVAIVYTDAGLSKLLHGGLLWWSPPQIQTILYDDTLNPNDFGWTFSLMLPQWDIVFSALGLAAFVGELFYGLVLFFGWARLVFPPLMLLMHVGILFFQNILFLDLILVQLVFVDWAWVRKVVAKRALSRRASIEVLYDGQCPLCRRTVRIFRALDLFEQLRYTDFRQMNVEAYNRQYNLNLTLTDMDREMYVLDRGRPYVGFYAYRLMGLRVPALWPIVPWLFIPGITHIGIAVYRYIARERLKLLRCEDACAVQTGDQILTSDRAQHIFQPAQPVVIMLSAGVLLFSSLVYGIEYFPITAFGMYSERLESGPTTYYKVRALNTAGIVQSIHLEDTIAALGHNRFRFRLWQCFNDATIGMCKKIFLAAGQAYNKKVLSQQQLERFEIEKWVWDFHENPKDFQYGRMDSHIAVDLRDKTFTVVYPSLQQTDRRAKSQALSQNPP